MSDAPERTLGERVGSIHEEGCRALSTFVPRDDPSCDCGTADNVREVAALEQKVERLRVAMRWLASEAEERSDELVARHGRIGSVERIQGHAWQEMATALRNLLGDE